tara:strand:+ start:165 stop:317 length:153 start_codon:yes stop_codon:yes gene_type:complete
MYYEETSLYNGIKILSSFNQSLIEKYKHVKDHISIYKQNARKKIKGEVKK